MILTNWLKTDSSLSKLLENSFNNEIYEISKQVEQDRIVMLQFFINDTVQFNSN